MLFASRSVPVSLLGFPPRPGPRRLPTRLAAIALPRISRPKVLFTSFEQTPPGPWPARRPFAPAALLIFGMACSNSREGPREVIAPRSSAPEGIALLSGAQPIFRSIEIHNFIAKNPMPKRLVCPAVSFSRQAQRVRSYNNPARRNGSRHCRDATIAEGYPGGLIETMTGARRSVPLRSPKHPSDR